MQTLTIEIESENWDFLDSIDDIRTNLENWFTSWNSENDSEKYNFKII